MNLQQLEYIIALDTHRHFVKAADACFVTQATLSMMIKKLEQELDVVIFDRSKQPVIPTKTGKKLIEQARNILRESQLMKEISKEMKSGMEGELRIGIIPTLAPYLLPVFIPGFLARYPSLKLKIREQTTDQLAHFLATDKIDVAIMATPLHISNLKETPVFYEEFKVYVASPEKQFRKKYLLPEDIDTSKLWLLEEGHCLRSQALNLCELQKQQAKATNLDYETGSIESLLKITEITQGITIIPELATLHFNKKQKEKLRSFKPPVPVREISLVTFRHFARQDMITSLKKEILAAVSPHLSSGRKNSQVVKI